MSRVFISYKREERAKAEAIAVAIAQLGYDVWWDIELLPGDRFRDAIEEVIEGANVCVVLWSTLSVKSDFVIGEAALAKQHGILIPARLDEVKPPIDFRSLHTLNLQSWDGTRDHEALKPLIKAIARRFPNSHKNGASDSDATARIENPKLEAVVWKDISERNPQSVAEYEAYLHTYGESAVFARLARSRIAKLRALEAEAEADSQRKQPEEPTGKASVLQLRPYLAIILSSAILVIASVLYFLLDGSNPLRRGLVQSAQVLPVQMDNYWYQDAAQSLEQKLKTRVIESRAKNVVLMLADGLGIGTNMIVRIGLGQRNGRPGEENVLSYEELPYLALAKTYEVNAQTPSSGATAILTGIKTNSGVLGVDEGLEPGDCNAVDDHAVESIGDVLKRLGRSVGYVTTGRLTYSSTAAGYANSASKYYETDRSMPESCEQLDIADQLIQAMKTGNVDVAFGGGRQEFLPVDLGGRRADNRKLLEEAIKGNIEYVGNVREFDRLNPRLNKPVLGIFSDRHMSFSDSRDEEPTLAEMSAAAIDILRLRGSGFFLQVAAGRIDHAGHVGDLDGIINDGEAFADAVKTVMELTDPADTLVIVTGGHEMSVGFNGYCGRGSPVIGNCYEINPNGERHAAEPTLNAAGEPYPVVEFLNGRNSKGLDKTYSESANFSPPTTVQYLTKHSVEDVAVYASGPWAHLVEGTIELNLLFHVMLYAATYDSDGH